MKKAINLVLMLCLVLSGAYCYAYGADRTENAKKEGVPIVTIGHVQHGGTDKSTFIHVTIDRHTLMAVFEENIGQVLVSVCTADGTPQMSINIYTPNSIVCYIPTVGDNIITFTLANGNEYYGEFTVTD